MTAHYFFLWNFCNKWQFSFSILQTVSNWACVTITLCIFLFNLACKFKCMVHQNFRGNFLMRISNSSQCFAECFMFTDEFSLVNCVENETKILLSFAQSIKIFVLYIKTSCCILQHNSMSFLSFSVHEIHWVQYADFVFFVLEFRALIFWSR